MVTLFLFIINIFSVTFKKHSGKPKCENSCLAIINQTFPFAHKSDLFQSIILLLLFFFLLLVAFLNGEHFLSFYRLGKKFAMKITIHFSMIITICKQVYSNARCKGIKTHLASCFNKILLLVKYNYQWKIYKKERVHKRIRNILTRPIEFFF